MNTKHQDKESLAKDVGLNILTGESCAFGMRLLCDLNEDGVQNVTRFLAAEPTANNWNNYVGEKPAVKSIMLTHSAVEDLWVFTMVAKGAQQVHKLKGIPSIAIFNATAEEITEWKAAYGEYITESYRNHHDPRRGDRNVHEMSGRAA